MGVRAIGNKDNTGIRVSESERTISVRTIDAPPVEFRPIASEHQPDPTDNGSESDDAGTVDPTRIASSDGNSSGDSAPYGRTKSGRVRNRPVAGGNNSSKPTSKTTDSLANLVCMLHGVVANIVKVPALKITEDQSQQLTKAVLEVTELYDVPLPTEKVAAWMNLGAVAYKVYIVSDKPSKPFVVAQQQNAAVPNFMNG